MRFLFLILLSTLSLFGATATITALKGKATITRGTQTLQATNGTTLEVGDTITTAQRSKVQIIFEDNTAITLGKETTFNINDFIQSSNVNEATIDIKVNKGIFRAITGKIGKLNPTKFQLRTKTANIGIRGTHIVGIIEGGVEKVGCPQGEIVVSVNGVAQHLVGGEFTFIEQGGLPSPAEPMGPSDIVMFNSQLSIDPEVIEVIESLGVNIKDLIESLEFIASIENSDVASAQRVAIADALYAQIDALQQNKIEIGSTGTATDDYTPLTWGFSTEEPITSNDDGTFSVQGTTYNSVNEAIIAAVPDDLWRLSVSGQTPSTKLDEFIQSDYSSWDGTSGSGTVATYEGTLLGYVDDAGNNALFENSSIAITIDFKNRHLRSEFTFEAHGKTWNVLTNDIGKTIITPSEYSIKTFANSSGAVVLSNAQAFQNRYFGPEANQLSSYFQFLSVDNEDAYGILAAMKTNSYTTIKSEVGNDAFNTWGYWTKDAIADPSSDAAILASTVHGAWVTSKLAKTDTSVINAHISANKVATYSGEVFGNVQHNTTTNLMSNGAISLQVDFGADDISGNINFDAGADEYRVNVTSGDISGNAFTLTGFSDSGTGNVQTIHHEANGNFVGNQGERLVGGFNFATNDGKNAMGAFKASSNDF